MIEILYLIFLMLMLAQGILSIYLSLYIWEDPERLDRIGSPKEFEKPQTGFTILVPARHEQKVIGETIKSISNSNYPQELLELLIICEEKDTKTIIAAERAIVLSGITNARVITFNDFPINKPHSLNKGLWAASKEVIVIFDAEDEVSPDIFNVANTIFISQNPDIVQAGVQLMNYDSHWFSPHNVLEYYLWFKSRMHFNTRLGVVPLGGNTVFFKITQLLEIGGWDENCLTEDAEIGVRLSSREANIVSTYDSRHVTKEETPGSLGQFIKQRTRWNQGFIQVLKLGYWKEYDSLLKKLFCIYTLSFPIIQAILIISMPVVFYYGLTQKLPIELSLLSFIPLFLIGIQYVIGVIALREFILEQKLKHKKMIYLSMLLTLIPYQLLLGLGALRAVYREIFGLNNWEKTVHEGVHRNIFPKFSLDVNLLDQS